jgi:RNA polymerase sigma factor (sigma-70 family)
MAEHDQRFERWMHAHLGMLSRIARAFALGADQHDLMQELMLAVWRAAPSFRGDAKESTFIFRVVHNAALTWRRRERTRQRRHAEYERLVVPQTPHDSDELVARLHDAIRTLDTLDRSLMLLSLEGMSYAEIGDIHGLSDTNVGVRLSRARKKLAHHMEATS